MFEYLVFEEASFFSSSREIRLERDGDLIRYRKKQMGYGYAEENTSVGVYKGDSKAFISKLENLHIEDWPTEFFEPVLDGQSWTLRYKEVGKKCRIISGSNSFPDCYKKLVKLLESATLKGTM